MTFTNGSVFVDTNVLVYAQDASAVHVSPPLEGYGLSAVTSAVLSFFTAEP